MLRITASALFALLSITSAEAASRVWISEFGVLGVTNNGGVPAQIAALPSLSDQATLDLTGGTAQTSASVSSQTKFIRIICEVQCAVKVGGTATASSMLLPAFSAEYFGIQPGTTISVISAP
jgi:hypothetical protein